MTRWLRFCLIVSLLAPALLLVAETKVLGQRGAPQTDIVWRCSKCKGLVGSGPNPPTLCPHCKTKLVGSPFNWASQPVGAKSPAPKSAATERGDKGTTPSTGTVVAVGVVILTMAGLVGLVLRQANH